ncbi:MAG: hypothetical protein ACAI38_15620 [Myxococcota bacterium]
MRTLPNKSADPTVVRRNRVLRFGLDGSRAASLAPEPRRALALLRALELAGNGSGAKTLLGFGGATLECEATTPTIKASTCERIARAMRDKGYPLTDRGVKLFKMEHGFSGLVRIGPDVAQAYVRWAGGKSTRVEVSEVDETTREERRAIEILRIIGREPDELKEVFKVLGLPRFRRGETVDLGKTHGQALLSWASGMSWSFDDDGWKRIAKASGERDSGARVTATIAHFVRDTLLGAGEPEHDYRKQTFGEHTVNARTLKMLQQVQRTLHGRLKVRLIRGSYTGGDDDRGAHPHQGGGAVDLSVRGMGAADIDQLVLALREAGFAAWYRAREDRPHVHAVAVGDREMSASAAWQVRAYFRGRDGRSHAGPDAHKHLSIRLPKWLARYRLGA